MKPEFSFSFSYEFGRLIASWGNLIHLCHPVCFFNIHFDVIFPLSLGLPSLRFPSGFPTKTLRAFFLSPPHIICPDHPFVLDLTTLLIFCHSLSLYLQHAVAQLVEELSYKPEGGGFNSRWYHWNFSLTQPLTEISTRNISCGTGEGGKGGRCVGLTTLPPSCVDCLEFWELKPPGTFRACPVMELLYLCTLYICLAKLQCTRHERV